MTIPLSILILILLCARNTGCEPQQALIQVDQMSVHPPADNISLDTRAHWMRRAIRALSDTTSPCPFAAFGSVIVNHTAHNGLGDEICMGVNSIGSTGNPTLHGEMAAISNCSKIFADEKGRYDFTADEALLAFRHLSLYTTAEACPMCASAIRWSGLKEYIYGSSIEKLVHEQWSQIRIDSQYVFERSEDLGPSTRLIAGVLHNETDVYFGWQYNDHARCPPGCVRQARGQCDVA